MISIWYLICLNLIHILSIYHESIYIIAFELNINQTIAYTLYTNAIQCTLIKNKIDMYTKAILYYPSFQQAYNNLASLLADQINNKNDIYNVIYLYKKAAIYSDINDDNHTFAAAHNNIGWFYRKISYTSNNYNNILKAIKHYNIALNKIPFHIDSLYNKASAYIYMKNYNIAYHILLNVLKLDPNHISAHMDLGNIYFQRGNINKAIYHQDFIIKNGKNKKNIIGAYNNKGQFLKEAGHIHDALIAHEKALEIDPKNNHSLVHVITARRTLCYWDKDDYYHDYIKYLTINQLINNEFPLLSVYDSTLLPFDPIIRKEIASKISNKYDQSYYYKFNIHNNTQMKDKKLRIGYLSYDFRDHPMGHLTIGALENHNKINNYHEFNIYCFSYGANDDSEWRNRSIKACNQYEDNNDIGFNDIRHLSDLDGSEIIYNNKINILIDLMGHTKGARLGLAALKPAPIVVNYLGFPGSMGSKYTDYIIVDSIVAPISKSENYFTEKMIYLPYIYQVNDYDIYLNPSYSTFHSYSMSEIPEDYFVFCNFNTINKMEIHSYTSWMNILKRVPKSIIWLLRPVKEPLDKIIINKLHLHALANGISKNRIIFADRLNKRDHLKRIANRAHLFLDSFIYDAHSTGTDVLWMHIPIITLIGEGFPSRVASSLLRTIGLECLITYSKKEYEDLAVDLALDYLKKNASGKSSLIKKFKQVLKMQTLLSPLFDSLKTTYYLEKSYKIIWELYNNNNTKHHVFIRPTHKKENYKKEKTQYYVNKLLDFQKNYPTNYNILISGYERLLSVFSETCADCWQLFGLAYYQLDSNSKLNCEKAIIFIEKSIRLLPNVSFYYSNLAHIYQSCKKNSIIATKLYKKSIETDPSNYHSIMLFMDNVGKENYIEIISVFEKYILNTNLLMDPVVPDDAKQDLCLKYFHALANIKEIGKAIKFLEIFLKMNDSISYSKLSYNLAALYMSIGNKNDSYKILSTIVLKESYDLYNLKGKYVKKKMYDATKDNKKRIIFYCNEYGQTWWPSWGPGSEVKEGVGGSEEALIYLSRNLVSLGFWVEIYNNVNKESFGEDKYGVLWYPYYSYNPNEKVDVFISWRYLISLFLANGNANLKMLWLHDIIDENNFPDYYFYNQNNKLVDKIVCVSDFHLQTLPKEYKNIGLVIPNGLDTSHFLEDKDINNDNTTIYFIYGSAPNRGLENILKIWEKLVDKVKEINHFITLKLNIYYGFTPKFEKFSTQHYFNNDHKKYLRWKNNKILNIVNRNIDTIQYNGLVNHEILAKAYMKSDFFLYPTLFSEISCISLLKAMSNGVIPITSKYIHSVFYNHKIHTNHSPYYPNYINDPICQEFINNDHLINISNAMNYDYCFDLGPEKPFVHTKMNETWLENEWLESILLAIKRNDLNKIRKKMILYSREKYNWKRIAYLWKNVLLDLEF